MKKIIYYFKVVPTTLKFVDVAGLVKGASNGKGLGDKCLATIRQYDAIVHVVQPFEDKNVIHIDGNVDLVRDAELINLELALSNLSQAKRRYECAKRDRLKRDTHRQSALEKLVAVLENDEAAHNAELTEDEEI